MKIKLIIEDRQLIVGTAMLGPLLMNGTTLPGHEITLFHEHGFAHYIRFEGNTCIHKCRSGGRQFMDKTVVNMLDEIESAVPADDDQADIPVHNRIVIIERDEDLLLPSPDGQEAM